MRTWGDIGVGLVFASFASSNMAAYDVVAAVINGIDDIIGAIR